MLPCTMYCDLFHLGHKHQLSISVNVTHNAVQCHEASRVSADIAKLLLQMKPVVDC